MSYCRFDPPRSQAYIFATMYGNLECLACRLTPVGDWFGIFSTNSRSDMLRHMQDHRQKGQKVPFYASRRLKREIKEVGDRYEVK